MEETCKKIEACFITTTQYQFMIADIYARYLYDQYGIHATLLHRVYNGFDIAKFNTDGKYKIVPYILNNDTILGKCIFTLQCGYLFSYMAWNKLLNTDKRILLFVFVDGCRLAYRMIDYVKKIDQRNRVILIEEGTATYLDGLNLKHEKRWRAKQWLCKIVFGCGRVSDVPGDNQLIDTAIVKDPERYRKLKKAKNQKVVQQSTEIMALSGAFMEHYAAASIADQKYDVLYLGQPYYRNGRFNEPEDDCLKVILSKIPPNLRVLIKPHPRDQKDKYQHIVEAFENVSLIDASLSAIPVEALIGMLQTKIVVSIQSSASVTLANMMPQIQSFVLGETPEAKSMFKAIENAGEIVLIFSKEDFPAKYNNIYFPETMEAFSDALLQLNQEESEPFSFANKQTKSVKLAELDGLVDEAVGSL